MTLQDTMLKTIAAPAVANEEILLALVKLFAEERKWMVFGRAEEAVRKICRAAAGKDILIGAASRLADKDDFIAGRAALVIGDLGSSAPFPDLLAYLMPLLRTRNKNGMAIARAWKYYRFVRTQSPDATWILRPLSELGGEQ
jgi:hypothetical protein